jgi:hypothetical protein
MNFEESFKDELNPKTKFIVSNVIINFIDYSCSIVIVPKVARKRMGMVPFWI